MDDEQSAFCQTCGTKIEFPVEMAGQLVSCPSCGGDTLLGIPAGGTASRSESVSSDLPPTLPSAGHSPDARQAIIESKSEFMGVGCLIQGVGIILILCFPFFPFSTVLGIVLLIVGGRMAKHYLCSLCQGKVLKTAQVCQHCSSTFVR